MKALRINIYKNNGSDCSNHGISERFNEILLVCESGYIDVNGDEPNLCKLVKRTLFGGREYMHVEPVARPNGIGWMAGGTLVYSCDSRFRELSEYPLSLHDRCESQREYDELSK